MINKRLGDWMVTYTGKKFYPIDPRVEDVDIEDIAHALSMNNRFNGHTTRPYSVGYHSLLCSYHVEPGYELEALLHDATEAYLADVVRPAKQHMPEYKAIEQNLWEEAIAPKFGLNRKISNAVHLVDNRMLVTEAAQLMGPNSPKWWEDYHWPEPFPDLVIGEPTYTEVKEMFLARFYELMEKEQAA